MDGRPAVTEFFAPFVHIEGKYEWCVVRSPTHGVFPLFIVLGASTAVPATVYASTPEGHRFMQDRYPECTTHAATSLDIEELDGGRRVRCRLISPEGPIRRAVMDFTADDGVPTAVPYGGDGQPVWGGRFTCQGVDLNLRARVEGHVSDGLQAEEVSGPGILTLGSYGHIRPLSPS